MPLAEKLAAFLHISQWVTNTNQKTHRRISVVDMVSKICYYGSNGGISVSCCNLSEWSGGINIMKDVYITSIHIDELRHLRNIDIPISNTEKKHLILTGRNGAGKSSVLSALWALININVKHNMGKHYRGRESEFYKAYLSQKPQLSFGLRGDEQEGFNILHTQYAESEIALAFMKASRQSNVSSTSSIESIASLEDKNIDSQNSSKMQRYLVALDYTRMGAREDGNNEEADRIAEWFSRFEGALKEIYNNKELQLINDRKTFEYKIHLPDRPAFDFNQMADGYSAFINIMMEIVMRMEFSGHPKWDLPGIVLIDEVETHLHIDLQKKILPFLTSVFPNVQFIVTTHSPFVISSIKNAVIFDLEKKIAIADMTAYSYEGIINEYFGSDMYSASIKQQFSEYQRLYAIEGREPDDEEKFLKLVEYFNTININSAEELVYAFREMELQRRTCADGENK